jgi:Protein of unknown function (DUF2917)
MECRISKGELFRLDGGKGGLKIICSTGAIWLTTGDGVDRIIKAGFSFEIPSGCLAVAEALELTELCLGEAKNLGSVLHKPLTGFVAI